MPRPIIINQQNRFRATSRQAAKAILSLYGQKANLKKTATRLGARARLSSIEHAQVDLKSRIAQIPKSKLTTQKTRFSNYLLRTDLVHELTHISNKSRNHLVTARALETYLGLFGRKMVKANNPSLYPLIEQAYSKNLKKNAKRNENLIVKNFMPPGVLEHTPFVLSRSFSALGEELVVVALNLDQGTKVGAGAILIREVSNGKKIEETIRAIKEKKYDAEINEWLKTNPAVKRLLKKR